MTDDLIRQLDSPDPERRKNAIKALARAEDRAALKPLAALYRSDPDDEVRELALKAGRYIKKRADEEAAARSASPALDLYEAAETLDQPPPEKPKRKEVSSRDAQRARNWLEQAQNLHWGEENEKAAKTLAKALQTDPDLWNDPYVTSLVESVTGMPYSDAYDMLMGGGEVLIPKTKRKEKRRERGPREATWADALTDLAIYAVVFFAIVMLGGIVFLNALTDALESAGPEGLGLTEADYDAFLHDFKAIGPVALLLVAGVCALFQVVALLVQDVAIHVAATWMLGGDGTLTGLIHKTTLFFTVAYTILMVLSFVAAWPGLLGAQATNSLSAVVTVGGVGVFVWTLWLIGETYQFGLAKGCAAVFLGWVLLGAVFTCALFSLVSSVAG